MGDGRHPYASGRKDRVTEFTKIVSAFSKSIGDRRLTVAKL